MDSQHSSPRAQAARELLARVTTEAAFQDLTLEAARRLGVAYTQISVVTDRVVAAAGQIPVARGDSFDLDQSVCPTVLRTEAPLVSDDLAADPRLMSIDAVTGGLVRAYAGVPIRLDPEGHVVGVFCAYDPAVRHWTADEIDVLEEYAAKTVDAMRSLT